MDARSIDILHVLKGRVDQPDAEADRMLLGQLAVLRPRNPDVARLREIYGRIPNEYNIACRSWLIEAMLR